MVTKINESVEFYQKSPDINSAILHDDNLVLYI